MSNKLRFLPLFEALDDRALNAKNFDANLNLKIYEDLIRDVERGAQIVAVVPYDIKVILQMPRGNLEGIYPRMLALDMVKTLLSK